MTHLAELRSENSVQFGFPYGQSRVVLIVRDRAGELDAYLVVERGQFFCSSFSGATISAKFDDGAVEEFGCSEAAAGASDAVFIHPEGKFLGKLKMSRRLIIEAPFFQAGLRQFTFASLGLKWEYNNPAPATSPVTPPTASSLMTEFGSAQVTQTKYGAAWPFSDKGSAAVWCKLLNTEGRTHQPAITVDAGVEYGLNAGAQQEGYPGIEALPHFAELSPGQGDTILHLFDIGASLCGGRANATSTDDRAALAASLRKSSQPATLTSISPARIEQTPPTPITSHAVTADDYPPVSIRLQEQGTVAIKYLVKEDGTVAECAVTTSSGKTRLDDAACTMVRRRWKFKPATEAGRPVSAYLTDKVNFELR